MRFAKSVSATEQEAVKLKIIDLVAEDIPALLKHLHGRKIALPNGSITLSSETAILREFPMGTRLELLKILSDPNIAYLSDVHRNDWDYGRTLQPRGDPTRHHRGHQLDPGILFTPVAPCELRRRAPRHTRSGLPFARNFGHQLWDTGDSVAWLP